MDGLASGGMEDLLPAVPEHELEAGDSKGTPPSKRSKTGPGVAPSDRSQPLHALQSAASLLRNNQRHRSSNDCDCRQNGF